MSIVSSTVIVADDLLFCGFPEEIKIEAVSLLSTTELFWERNLFRAAFLKNILESFGDGIIAAVTLSTRSEMFYRELIVATESCGIEYYSGTNLLGGFSRFFPRPAFTGVLFFSIV